MTVKELSREQLVELKSNYLDEKNQDNGEGTSYGELCDADELISDDEIFSAYDGYDFSNDDFACSCGDADDEDEDDYEDDDKVEYYGKKTSIFNVEEWCDIDCLDDDAKDDAFWVVYNKSYEVTVSAEFWTWDGCYYDPEDLELKIMDDSGFSNDRKRIQSEYAEEFIQDAFDRFIEEQFQDNVKESFDDWEWLDF